MGMPSQNQINSNRVVKGLFNRIGTGVEEDQVECEPDTEGIKELVTMKALLSNNLYQIVTDYSDYSASRVENSAGNK